MVLTPLGTANGYGCPNCRAVFLSHEHAGRVREGMDRVAPVQAEQAAAGAPYVDASRDTAVLACPLCRQAMTPQWVTGKYVRIDACIAHGVFFDAHELAALVPSRPLVGALPGHKYDTPGALAVGALLDVFLG